MSKNILIITPQFVKDVCLDQMVNLLKRKNYNVKTVVYNEPLNEDEIIPLIKDVDGYIVGLEKITKNILDQAKKLKVITGLGVGVDNIDIDTARKKGIFITNVPGVNSYTVAEMTIALMLSLARNIVQVNQTTKEGKWERKLTHELRNKTLGIIGLGNIGKWVSKLASAFQMVIVAYAHHTRDINFTKKIGIEYVGIEYLIKNSDFISLHIPYCEETKNFIGKDELKLMKKNAYLLNMSRGGIVDEKALYIALKEKWIAGAALDVFVCEKPGHKKIYELDNVISTPHIASVTYEATTEQGLRAVQNIIDILENGNCKNIVNR